MRKLVPIHAVALQCQIRIEPGRRGYTSPEQEKLLDLFDRPSRWGQTLRLMLWTHANVGIGPFTDSIVVDLPVPCTYDFNVAVTKYFYALEGGEIPVNLLFSGTMFHEADDGALQVAQIPWDREAAFPPEGIRLEGNDGAVLSQQCLALLAQGCVRSALRV